jgi:V8-like Glu-specific endopeptidase
MFRNESVSYEQKIKTLEKRISEKQEFQLYLHDAVSNDGRPGGQAFKAEEELIEKDFRGMCGTGEIESVSGFDPARVLSEGFAGAMRPITEAEKSLSVCCPLEFDPESICDKDDRFQINQTTMIPWRWICQLIITAANGAKYLGTGWFIGPHTVMTVGHDVFYHDAGGWAKQIEIIPGRNGVNLPFKSQITKSFRSVVGWTKNKDANYDYGAIILSDNTLGNKVGWFGFASLPESSLESLLVNISGYPGDKNFGTQWYNAGRITKVTPRRFYYMIDTCGGQAGSPVWRYYNGQRYAAGIANQGGCPNSAIRIIKAVFDNMVKWRY